MRIAAPNGYGGTELLGSLYLRSARTHPSFDLVGPRSYNRLNKNNAGAPRTPGFGKVLAHEPETKQRGAPTSDNLGPPAGVFSPAF